MHKKIVIPHRIRTHNLSLVGLPSSPLHYVDIWRDLVEYFHYTAFYKNAGLLEQQAHESRNSPMSRWLFPADRSNKSLVSSFKQRWIRKCFSFMHSWICLLDVDNGIICHELNGARVAGDCTYICRVSRERFTMVTAYGGFVTKP